MTQQAENFCTVFNDQEFLPTQFLKNLGVISNPKTFFKTVPVSKKLKVVQTDDYELAQKFAGYENCNLFDWFIPVDQITLSESAKEIFNSTGFVDLVDKTIVSSRVVRSNV